MSNRCRFALGLHHPVWTVGVDGTVVKSCGRVGDPPIVAAMGAAMGTRHGVETVVGNKASLGQHRFITGVNSGTLTGESCPASN